MTIKMIWDPLNPVFEDLKKAYFAEDPFYVDGHSFCVKSFKTSDPLENDVIEVESELVSWCEVNGGAK